MPVVLRNVLSFTGLVIGVPVTSSHGIQDQYGIPKLPQNVFLDGGGYNVTVDSQAITLQREAAGADAVKVEFWRWHSIEDAEPQPGGIPASYLPMIVQAGGGSAGGGIQIAAGTQTAATGTVVFSNSNGLSFGMSNSSLVTASMDAFRSVIALGGTATGPTLSFLNANGVTFGMNGRTITASVQTAGGTATGVAISAGTEVATTGAVIFSNSNGISFGLNAQTLTATFAAIKTISASGGSVTNGQLSFANSNGMTFGINAGTITASYNSGWTLGVPKVIGFTATGGETRTTVTFTPAFGNTSYSVFGQLNGVASIFGIDCPAGSANRSVSAFVVDIAAAMVSNDALAFFAVPL